MHHQRVMSKYTVLISSAAQVSNASFKAGVEKAGLPNSRASSDCSKWTIDASSALESLVSALY